MTVFHLVRHGSHDLLGRVLVGRGPVALSAQGAAEAAATANALAAAGLAAVFSSPQQRAMQTAQAIAAQVGLPVETLAGIDEIDMGAWTGATFEALHAEAAWQAFNIFRGTAQIPGGETMLAAQTRAIAALLQVQVCHPHGAVAMVSHADVIKGILAHALGMPLDMMGRIEIGPASRSIVELYDRAVMVRAINLPPGT
jgi:broad specificity phosphatase PhoE